MSKTRTNLEEQVRTYLDEASQDDWTDVEVRREINAKYLELYTAIIEVYEDYYSTKTTTASVADQQEYTLPSDFYKMRRVEIDYAPDNSQSVPSRAIRVSMDDVHRDLGNSGSSLTVHARPAYYIRGDFLGFIPVPTKAGSTAITIWYIKTVSELSSSSSSIDIPFADRYAQIISLGAAATLLRKGQQEEVVASRYLLEYEDNIKKMKQELEDRIADGGRGVTDLQGEHVDFVDGLAF